MSIGVGTRLGRFEVLSRLGAGGMGEVYLARDTHLGRNVALKVLAPGVSADAERVGRFQREAVAASSLNHPNILTIYDVGEADGVQFIATEYVEGDTMRAFLAASRDLRLVVDLFIQLCTALETAHAAGIVHRDLKPENVMLRRDGYVKVLDFGLAKLLEADASSMFSAGGLTLTGPGTVLGTVDYMSPEQAQAHPVDTRADIWSIGVMLYEVLSGRPPFRGEAPIVVLSQIIRREPQPLLEVAPWTPEPLARVVEKALRKNRDERYQTMGELLADLRTFNRGLEPTVEPAGATETTAPRSVGATQIYSGGLAPRRHTNLSGALPPLIGRGDETAMVVGLLGDANVRLVTLTGPGGTGKTRLAQQIGRNLCDHFADGVFFVDLSATSDTSLVASAIAQVLGVDERGAISLAGALAAYLADMRLLLIVDNFEQVADAGPLLLDLLGAAPGLKLLVTSRARLHLRAEREVEVPPLEVPPPGADVEEIRQAPAVRLFVDRATAVSPDFVLTDEDARTVAEICRHLDGLPLAIELAAARIKVLAPRALLRRLGHRLKLLAGGALDLPERQQTMRATVAWSYDLLDTRERALFRRLAVFAGGFTLEAAEAIDAAAAGGADVVDAVASLVDKSLMRQRRATGEETRFRMLEVVREFGLECLEASGEAARVAQAHADYFLALAEAAAPGLIGADPSPTLQRLAREHDNIRAALEWSFAAGGDSGPRLAATLTRFWSARNHYAEGRRWLEQALGATTGQRTALRARLLTGYGHIAQAQRDRQASLPRFEESLEIARELGDRTLVAAANVGIGIACTDFGDFARARTCYEEVLVIARERGDQRLAFHALNNLGEVARGERDYGAARAYYEAALAHGAMERSEWAGNAHVNLGAIAYYEARYADMPGHFGKSLDAFRRTGDHLGVATALSGFGAHATATGEAERAARLAGAVEAICESLGTRLDISDEVLFDEWRAHARRAVGTPAYDAAAAEGRRMTRRQAIDYALRETQDSQG
jgi:predicted ATPase